uniref:Protein C10 n=1 Tax=Mucochytrium quahogii TaxID=96639 RepID=A0A7S2RZL4_9STRA|mmetsp:Transcript_18844/g.30804  ORF Transcript_18844/g.30804 Transcript_18844/m.30804 type:complete len:288 (-) Transcript_18844:1128-1991(-)|eukprot:CAMPEP_0203749692 /NCGR_PEP_ID=MMETSP0098-20131031/4154_1 /ASSEMBLY_ACC=CAM_ASM_000208 /TAXON_ID=96639 /ORGANISM=" , Strain NY0313808BC1" /LENGTH=287 /DNA_ID=CAMNT_0050638785 /DNA_START=27 /DNA_END=890 /DNA_ORIENTATION=-
MFRRALCSFGRAGRSQLRPRAPCVGFSGRGYLNVPRASLVSIVGPERGFCTFTPEMGRAVTAEQAVGVAETILMYLECGIPGEELDKIRAAEDELISTRVRKMLSIFVSTQLHVIVPFGFEGTQQAIEEYGVAQHQTLQGMKPDDPLIEELKKVMIETWTVMLHRAFGIESLPQMTLDQVRQAAAMLGSRFQDPEFLEKVGQKYSSELRSLVESKDMDKAHDELQMMIVPLYLSVIEEMKLDGMAADELGFVQLQTVINQNMSDQIIAQNIQAGFMSIAAKAPLQQG